MIQGIHHVCLKADTQENYIKAITFYTEVLGCSIKRQWDYGIMLDTGHGLIEIFNQADTPLDQGVIPVLQPMSVIPWGYTPGPRGDSPFCPGNRLCG